MKQIIAKWLELHLPFRMGVQTPPPLSPGPPYMNRKIYTEPQDL